MCFSHAEALGPLRIMPKNSSTAVKGLTMVHQYANPILGSWQPRRQAKTKAGFAIRVRKPSNRGMYTSRWEDFQGEGQLNYQRALIGGLGRWPRYLKQDKRGNNHGGSRQGSQGNRPMGTILNVNLGLRHMDPIGKMSYDLLLLLATVFPGYLRRWPSSKLSPSEHLQPRYR